MCLMFIGTELKSNQKHMVSVNPVTNTGSQATIEGIVPLKYPVTNNNLNTHHITISTATKVVIYCISIPHLYCSTKLEYRQAVIKRTKLFSINTGVTRATQCAVNSKAILHLKMSYCPVITWLITYEVH
jgi:hypothetical protein